MKEAKSSQRTVKSSSIDPLTYAYYWMIIAGNNINGCALLVNTYTSLCFETKNIMRTLKPRRVEFFHPE
jgi:hypothetical protein